MTSDLFQQIVSLSARDVKVGHGSFITMGFGQDLYYENTIRGKKEIRVRPEWYLWVYMCFWEIKQNDQCLITSDDPREEMQSVLNKIENKKLIAFEMLNKLHEMRLEFEDNIVLTLIPNNEEDDNEQWMLFTPDRMCLTAGPADQITYQDASS